MKGNFIINDKTSNFMKLSLSAYYKLDTITLGVYCKLLGLGENWEMIPKALPSVLNLSKDKTIASIKTLEREGFLQRVAAKDVHGKFVGYIYRLNAEPAPAEERTRAGLGYVNSGLPENGVVQKPSTPKTGNPENPQPNNIENNNKYKDFNKNNKENNKEYKHITPSDEGVTFEQFWDAYGVKKSKKDAERAWKKLSKADKDAAMKAIPAYQQDCVRCDRQRQYAATYLNKRTFEDDFSFNDNNPNNNGRDNIRRGAWPTPAENATRAEEWATNRILELTQQKDKGIQGEIPDNRDADKLFLPF